MKLNDLLPFFCKELHTLYAVKEEIGRGGFGVVYAAKRKSDGVEVAIKKYQKILTHLLRTISHWK